MRNPFKTALPYAPPVSVPTHHQEEHYEFPSEYDVSAQHDDPAAAWEAQSGYPVVSNNFQSGDWHQDDPQNPGYARHYHLGFVTEPGLVGNPNADLMPGPGANSLTAPHDVGGRPAEKHFAIGIEGPVTGQESNWTGQTVRVARRPLMGKGPVTGSDYGSQLTAAFYQQANSYFDIAAAQASLVAAI